MVILLGGIPDRVLLTLRTVLSHKIHPIVTYRAARSNQRSDPSPLHNEWEYGHAGGFGAQLIGLCALVLSVLVETPKGLPRLEDQLRSSDKSARGADWFQGHRGDSPDRA